MVEVINKYLQRHYEQIANASLAKRVSYDEARKLQPYYQYLDLDKQSILRNKDEPVGLRNIGNTCYLNIFMQLLYHVNDVRDMFVGSAFKKEKLLVAVQSLFAQMMFTRFSYCDTEEVFNEFNRASASKNDSGAQYDFHQYLSVQLDNIEKSLRKQGLNNKADNLSKVFCGKYRQILKAGQEVSENENKFGMVTLDIKLKTFQTAFEAFRNYRVQGFKTKSGEVVQAQVKTQILEFPSLISFFINRVRLQDGELVKSNQKFDYPQSLQLDTTTNELVENLTADDLILEKKINDLEGIISKKQYKHTLQSLKVSLKFLQGHPCQAINEVALDLGGIDMDHGAALSQENLDIAKSVLQSSINKFQRQEQAIAKTLAGLRLQKKNSLDYKKVVKCSLFALMIHQGSAASGHYYILIHSDQKRWRKYSDRVVEEISQEEVHLIASGQLHHQTSVCCLIYKRPTFLCNPLCVPTIPVSLRNQTVEVDKMTTAMVSQARVQRMVRTCVSIAQQETQFYINEFDCKADMCIEYFAQPVNYFIQVKNFKMAQLARLKTLLYQQSFLHEIATQLSLREFQPPKIQLPYSKDYLQCVTSIAKALGLERGCYIQAALATLCLQKPKQPHVLGYYQEVMVVFLLKGCFYLDLLMQMGRPISLLVGCLVYMVGTLKKSVFTSQINSNINNSVQVPTQYLKQKLNLSKIALSQKVATNYVSMKKVFDGRFEPWLNMFVTLKSTQKTISHEDKSAIETPLYVQYIGCIK